MKLLNLNCHSWLEDNQIVKLNVLVDYIVAHKIDIITLQEVNQSCHQEAIKVDEYFCKTQENIVIKKDNYAYLLINKLREQGYNYYWSYTASHIGYDKFDEGSAILSVNPFEATAAYVSEEVDYKNYHSRKILCAQYPHSLLINCHLSWWPKFTVEWRNIEKIAQAQQNLIIVGDFNNDAKAINEGYQLVMNSVLNLQDAYVVANHVRGDYTVVQAIDGWADNQQQLRIDYVFTSQHYQVNDYRVVFDNYHEEQISDHYGLYVKLASI